MNIPPTATGRMNASVVAVMAEAGTAINNTFKLNDAGSVVGRHGECEAGVVSVIPTGPFDYIVTMEDLQYGQRIGNYSIDFRRVGSETWEVLVPAVQPTPPPPPTIAGVAAPTAGPGLKDRPDGNDPRDSHVGHKRIDVPAPGVKTSGADAINMAEIRFNCLSKVRAAAPADQVYVRRFSLHKRDVPWEP